MPLLAPGKPPLTKKQLKAMRRNAALARAAQAKSAKHMSRVVILNRDKTRAWIMGSNGPEEATILVVE